MYKKRLFIEKIDKTQKTQSYTRINKHTRTNV